MPCCTPLRPFVATSPCHKPCAAARQQAPPVPTSQRPSLGRGGEDHRRPLQLHALRAPLLAAVALVILLAWLLLASGAIERGISVGCRRRLTAQGGRAVQLVAGAVEATAGCLRRTAGRSAGPMQVRVRKTWSKQRTIQSTCGPWPPMCSLV